ncbi:MAG: hypothetical protein NVS9B8_05750 [Candidatus Limnocylindrales bacterium]
MGALSPLHLVFILVIAVLVVGPGKLPETGAAIGKAIREFRHSVSGDLDETSAATTPAIAASPADAPAGTASGPRTEASSSVPANPPRS